MPRRLGIADEMEFGPALFFQVLGLPYGAVFFRDDHGIKARQGRIFIIGFKNRPVMKDPHVLITTRAEIIAGLRDRSNRSFGSSLKLAKEELKQVKARVRALSPQSTLDRGYSVVQLTDGQIVTDPKRLKTGDELRLRLAKGESKATVK